MNLTVRDAALVAGTVSLAGLLGGLWFSMLSPTLALGVTTVTSFTLGVGNVWWFYRQQEVDATDEDEGEDDRDDAA